MRTELLMGMFVFGLGVLPAFSQSRDPAPLTQNLTRAPARASGLSFKDLPWSVQKAMLGSAGRAGIEQVEKIDLKGRTVYLGHYKKYGKAREVLVASDGSLVRDGSRIIESAGAQWKKAARPIPLSKPSRIGLSELPIAARSAIDSRVAGAMVERVDKGTLNGETIYEAAFRRGDRAAAIRVREDGKVLGEY